MAKTKVSLNAGKYTDTHPEDRHYYRYWTSCGF
jgi:hypothetical protein